MSVTLAQAAPTGGQVAAGTGTISQTGAVTTVKQTTQNLTVNWNTFNVAANETVNFVQPSASALAVNRIYDTNGSQILGQINANGQVWLLNPNGVLFGQGAQVNVGGLVASALNFNEATLASSTRTFSGNGTGSIINQGTITAADGGYVALLGNQVSNQGIISARLGTVALGAGSAVSLSFNGDRLLSMQVDQSTLNNLAENRQLIRADGGQVLMTAGAKDSLLASVVNNTGVIEARTVEQHEGKIILLGGMAAGTTTVGGTLDASAPNGGNGGFIETSAANVNIADGANVTTLAAAGKLGTWLVDPTDFAVVAGNGAQTTSSIGAATLSSTLLQTNVTLATDNVSGSGNGDIHVNAPVTWAGNGTLTLSAYRNININAPISGTIANNFTSTPGKLALEYGQGAVAANNSATYSVLAPVTLKAGANFSTKLGSNGVVKQFTVITELGSVGSTTGTDLQGITNLSGNYALGANIDAAATAGWNSGAGFAPISGSTAPADPNPSPSFKGIFEGLGHTVSNLTINRPSTDYNGLIGNVDALGVVRNVGLVGGSVTGRFGTGALAGNNAGSIFNSFAGTAVAGAPADAASISTGAFAGGLVGYNQGGTIANSYATGGVRGTTGVGGLVGNINGGSVSGSYSTGSASGANAVGGLIGGMTGGFLSDSYSLASATATVAGAGGLVGNANGATISTSYAAGFVAAPTNQGGLVGFFTGSITGSYWDSATTTEATGVGTNNNGAGVGESIAAVKGSGTPSTSIDAFAQATYGAFDFTNKWFIAADGTRPFLRNEARSYITNTRLLQLMSVNPGGAYYLGNNIDTAEVTALGLGMWKAASVSHTNATVPNPSGFVPVGPSFSGLFDGQGYTISNLTIQGGFGSEKIGLFASTASGASIRNVGLINGSFTGKKDVGALAGINGGSISASYASSGSVTGGENIGGLAGSNSGTISGSFSGVDVAVDGNAVTSAGVYNMGGLVGLNGGTIANSYATGSLTKVLGIRLGVTGGERVGMLVGTNTGGISDSYATGSVRDASDRELSSRTNLIGGLTGISNGSGRSTNFFLLRTPADSSDPNYGANAPQQSQPRTDSAMRSLSTFTGDPLLVTPSWDISANSYATSQSVWRIYDGATMPLLRSFLTKTDLRQSVTYNGTSQTFSLPLPQGVTAGGNSRTNAGTYATGNYSGQFGHDLNDSFTITPASIQLSVANVVKNYDGTTSAAATPTVTSGTLYTFSGGSSHRLFGGTFAFTDKNAGVGNKTVTVSGIGIEDGNNGNNYQITYADNTASTINQAPLSLAGTRTYDGTTAVNASVLGITGLVGTERLVLSGEGVAASRNVGLHAFGLGTLALANGANGGLTSNYTFTGGTRTIDITPAPLSLAGTRTYDGTTAVDASLLGITGLIGTERLLLSGEGVAASRNVGRNTFGVGTLALAAGANGGLASNYTFTGGARTVDFTPATLFYQTVPASALVGQVPTSLQVSVGKFFTGDTLANATTGTASFTTSMTSGSSPGLYAVNWSGLSATNYIFKQDAGNTTALTVNAAIAPPAAATATASATSTSAPPPAQSQAAPKPLVVADGSGGFTSALGTAFTISGAGVSLPDN